MRARCEGVVSELEVLGRALRKSAALRLPSEKRQVLHVVDRVTDLKCLVVHSQLVTPLRIEENQVRKEPDHEQEDTAGEAGATSCLLHAFPVNSQLYGLAKCVKGPDWPHHILATIR